MPLLNVASGFCACCGALSPAPSCVQCTDWWVLGFFLFPGLALVFMLQSLASAEDIRREVACLLVLHGSDSVVQLHETLEDKTVRESGSGGRGG